MPTMPSSDLTGSISREVQMNARLRARTLLAKPRVKVPPARARNVLPPSKSALVSRKPELAKSAKRNRPTRPLPHARHPAITKLKKCGEKRLRVYRKKASQGFLEKLSRARTQRMIVISRTRHDHPTCPSEEIAIVGSTGNIYTVTIAQETSCTCPDHRKGNECKHKVYALHTVLKAPEHLQYQLAFLSSELKVIFANAPPIPSDSISSQDKDGNRKPADGECPICYMDMSADGAIQELVWCKAACGNNMHKSCFNDWAASQKGQTVTCVYCRTPWEAEASVDLKSIMRQGQVTAEGYVNVAEQFGMSGARDYSSYYRPWVNRELGGGW